jgi:hypothetical protein
LKAIILRQGTRRQSKSICMKAPESPPVESVPGNAPSLYSGILLVAFEDGSIRSFGCYDESI